MKSNSSLYLDNEDMKWLWQEEKNEQEEQLWRHF